MLYPVIGKTYYGVELDQWSLPSHIVNWLNEYVGEDHYMLRIPRLYFDDERHRTMFLLKWGR